MKRQGNWLERLMDGADLQGEGIPGQPLVELLGERRVLIEHHAGVTEYGRERIRVRVKYGEIWVCGQHLEMMKMSSSQLIITGSIHNICLKRGQGK